MTRISLSIIVLLLAAAASAQTTLSIATVTPESSQWMKDMRASALEIKEKTGGRVLIKYYGGGVRGTDSAVLRKIRLNNLQGGAFTPAALMEIYPDIGLYGLPMVFESDAEASYVRSQMDSKITAGLEQAGFVSFGFTNTGFAMMMSNTPVTSLHDLKGKRVWVPEGDSVSRMTMDAFGVTPIPLPLTDVYTALQTGALDIIAMSAVGAVILQYHTKLKYITDLPLVYTFGFLAIEKKAFDKISDADQQIVREVMSELYARYDKLNVSEEQNAKLALFGAGMERIVPQEDDLGELQKVVDKTNTDIAAKGLVSAGLYEELRGHVADYRRAVASGETKEE
jgi:TRAP-type C4-dicarboxylate transport system substrate-binding protein